MSVTHCSRNAQVCLVLFISYFDDLPETQVQELNRLFGAREMKRAKVGRN